MYQVRAPVVLCTFNRPELTKQVLERVLSVNPGLILVIADAARNDRPGEQALCDQTRRVIEQSGATCEIRWNISNTNLGCKQRIATGLDWAFSQVSRAIILEDDCLPDVSFFEFCDELLERYQDCSDVHMISGSNYLQGRRFTEASYYFSRFYHVWGWATWGRAWQHFDVQMKKWEELRGTDWLESFLPTKSMARAARFFFDETYTGHIDTWDYQWVLSGWLNNANAIVPAMNMVSNLGFGSQATATKNAQSPLANLQASSMPMPMLHPESRMVDETADLHEFNLIYGQGEIGSAGLIRRLRQRGKRICNRAREIVRAN